ncbi:DUF928 domain-containing protein [Candidatus Gracilibacteria bacterium]|nr:DUF928 domain-containing protein [Candidatus Gracilibacteria bacterium]NJM89240.1 DUF928 domain-containing protein [Hydrococcus sp. RU_2_2]NJP21126.1 DUF928 domain-containing protein [Hydrococcus sp. CRU_1_1]NJQ98670.1 DUF928 domain-containing protein [Hydrococcus sp. CSU_1_8]
MYRRFTLARLAACILVCATSVLAQSQGAISDATPIANSNQSDKIRFIRVNSEDPDPKGTPSSEGGTGSRGDCSTTEIPLTRLVGSKSLELTVSDRPTFWFYIPYTAKEAPYGEFFLQDRKGNTLYHDRVKLSKSPGVVGFTLPAQVAPLAIEQKYSWYLTIDCPQRQNAPSKFPSPAFLTGEVQRIELTSELKNRIETAKTPLEKVKIYAQNGIWYETLTELANLYLIQPALTKTWADLLKDVGLEKLIQEPVLGRIH